MTTIIMTTRFIVTFCLVRKFEIIKNFQTKGGFPLGEITGISPQNRAEIFSPRNLI